MQLAAMTSFMDNVTGPMNSKETETFSKRSSSLPTSLTELSSASRSQVDASVTLQGATPCYPRPCAWVPGEKTSHSMGYYTGPTGAGIPTEAEMICPKGLHREWTTCNDGEMVTDGCRGYCAQDAMPGYISLMAPNTQSQASFALRLPTKGEFDLLREQLDRRWRTMYESLQKLLHQISGEVSDLEEHNHVAEHDNERLESVMMQQKLLAQGMEKALAGSMTELHDKVVKAFHKVEVQNQRAMIAGLHGHAGMCCCYFQPADSKEAKCSWHTFMGDIDQRTTSKFLNSGNIAQHLEKNRGAVQDVSFAGPANIRCGTTDDDSNQPMISYASLAASKSQVESLNQGSAWKEEYGPYYPHHLAALEQCIASPNWQKFMNTNVGGVDFSSKENAPAEFEFPAYDFDFRPEKSEQQLMKKFTDLSSVSKQELGTDAENFWFSVTNDDLASFTPKMTLQEQENTDAKSLLEAGSKSQRRKSNVLHPSAADQVSRASQMSKPKGFLGPSHVNPSQGTPASFAETAAAAQPSTLQNPKLQSQVKAGQGFSVQETSVRKGSFFTQLQDLTEAAQAANNVDHGKP